MLVGEGHEHLPIEHIQFDPRNKSGGRQVGALLYALGYGFSTGFSQGLPTYA